MTGWFTGEAAPGWRVVGTAATALGAGCAGHAPIDVPTLQPTRVTDIASPGVGVVAGGSGSGAAGPVGRTEVPPATDSLVAGGAFTCVRGTNGQISCCGNGWQGELGNGGHEDEGSPVTVKHVDDAVDLAAGVFHACARRANGSLWCWGENRWGQLGFPSYLDSKEPREVPGAAGTSQVALGILHSCARRADGVALCWGRNNVGQAGTGQVSEQDAALAPVVDLGAVVQVAVGWDSSCAVLPDGTVRCWGSNASGQLGIDGNEDRPRPVAVPGLGDVAGVVLGSAHGCAWHTSGTVTCWGSNGSRQLGDGTELPRPGLVPVAGLNEVVRLFAYETYTCALRRDGSVRCWGRGVPILARASAQERLWTPAGIPPRVTALALGNGHLCALDPHGALWCGGDGQHGQLCDGSSPPRSDTFPPPP